MPRSHPAAHANDGSRHTLTLPIGCHLKSGGGNFANVLSANKKSNIIAQYLIMFFSFCLSLSPIKTYANVAIKNRTRKKKQQNMGAFSLFRPMHPY